MNDGKETYVVYSVEAALVLEDEDLVSQVGRLINVVCNGDCGRGTIDFGNMEDFATWWL